MQINMPSWLESSTKLKLTELLKQKMPWIKSGTKLVDKSCWLHEKAREYRDVAAEAIRKGIKTHFGGTFEMCSIKGDELPEGHPDRKWKGRSVCQGNRVSDERDEHAIFAELVPAPLRWRPQESLMAYGCICCITVVVPFLKPSHIPAAVTAGRTTDRRARLRLS